MPDVPVCVQAEQRLAHALDPKSYQVEIVHLGDNKTQIADAEKAGVKSVPALVIDDTVFHINFGASLADLKRI
jgi:predicted DsbA family dithiol-disulfide isomerase